MKTLAEVLRDSDPLAYEPARSAQERSRSRQIVVSASRAVEGVLPRRAALGTIVAFTIAAIAVGTFQWSRATVVAAVRFEVRLAEEKPAPGLREAAIVGAGRTIYLHPEPVVANSDIVEAHVVPGNRASTFGVALTLNAEGGARMLRATQGHLGRPLAILVDGEVVAAPVVRSPAGTSGLISGDYTRAEADRIVGGIVGR